MNYKIAFWPLLITIIPLLYLVFSGAKYEVTSNMGASTFGFWVLLIPSALSSLCFLLFKDRWLARILLLPNTIFIKIYFIELNRSSDYLLNFPFLRIKRIWASEDLYNKVINVMAFYKVEINPKQAAYIVEEAQGSIVRANDLAIDYVNKLVNPSLSEVTIAFIYTHLPLIILTSIVGLILGAIYAAAKKRFFPFS